MMGRTGRPPGSQNSDTEEKVERTRRALQALTVEEEAWLRHILQRRGSFSSTKTSSGDYPTWQLKSRDKELVDRVKEMVGDRGPDREGSGGWVAYLGGARVGVLRRWLSQK